MRIDEIKYACEFDLHNDIIIELGEALTRLRREKGTRVQILNTPASAPPAAPRMIVQTTNAVINVALTRFDIVTRIPDHVTGTIESASDFSRQVLREALTVLSVPGLGYRWAGIVIGIRFPTLGKGGRASAAAVPVVQRLINIPMQEKALASFRLQIGVREGDFYQNYLISGYEVSSFRLSPDVVAKAPVPVEGRNHPTIEAGVNVVVDLNNRPQAPNHDLLSDLDDLFIEAVPLVNSVPERLHLQGLV